MRKPRNRRQAEILDPRNVYKNAPNCLALFFHFVQLHAEDLAAGRRSFFDAQGCLRAELAKGHLGTDYVFKYDQQARECLLGYAVAEARKHKEQGGRLN